MTGKLSKNFHGVGIGPLSNILAVKYLLLFALSVFVPTERLNFVKNKIPTLMNRFGESKDFFALNSFFF